MGLLIGSTDEGTRLSLFNSIVVLLATACGFALYRGYQVRRMFRRLQQEGIPILPHSLLLGHLATIGQLMSTLPPDAHGDYMMLQIQSHWRRLFPSTCTTCPPVLYLDLWPFAAPMIISVHPSVSAQFTQEHSLPKAWEQKRVLYPLTHNRDVSSMEGAEWRVWRRRLNPGFGVGNVMGRVGDVLEEVEVFVDILRSRAGKVGQEGEDEGGGWGEVFRLEELTTELAMDVIFRFFLNKRFHQQTGPRSPISTALLDTISRMYFYVHVGNILAYLNPWRHFKLWSNYRTLTRCLRPFIEGRILELQRNPHQTTNKTLVDLLVRSMNEETFSSDTPASTDTPTPKTGKPETSLPPDFLEIAIGQLTTFLFAGHDTTASTICWLLHLLSQHPDTLTRLREEHTTILGTDPASSIRKNPHLLNALPYTTAVIKESMRIHTNVGTMRRGEPGFFLTAPEASGPEWEGKKLPTEGFVVWDGTFAIHRSPEVWPRPDEFLPERFLFTRDGDGGKDVGGGGVGGGVDGDESGEGELGARFPHAWRFFELGPRGCIGRHLAMVEIMLVLVLVVGELEVECAWEEWDLMNHKKKVEGSPPMVWGDRCYQVGGDAPPHVKDGMPVHVRLRRRS